MKRWVVYRHEEKKVDVNKPGDATYSTSSTAYVHIWRIELMTNDEDEALQCAGRVDGRGLLGIMVEQQPTPTIDEIV